jgi:hypothetical protein
LGSDDTLGDLYSEVRDECEKYGKILCIKIPRPKPTKEKTVDDLKKEADAREQERQEKE